MDKAQIPVTYVRRLTDYLGGHSIEQILELFAEDACVERYVWGEPPRRFCGIEQIEESFLRLPPVGGSFHIENTYVEQDAVHAWFFTQGFPYPLRGVYRFELDGAGQIVRLYIAAHYHPSSTRAR